MGDLESCRPAFPPAGFATAHAGSRDKQNSSSRGPGDQQNGWENEMQKQTCFRENEKRENKKKCPYFLPNDVL